MSGAAERLTKRLVDVEIRAPRIRYISAVDAVAHNEPGDIRALLGEIAETEIIITGAGAPRKD